MTARVPILVAEDEVVIQMALEDLLRDAGFDPVRAMNGHQALAVIEAEPTCVRAVLTDIRLGSGPDGWPLASRARELMPTVPVVYMSAFEDGEWSQRGVPQSLMLAKPLALEDAVGAVSSLLGPSSR